MLELRIPIYKIAIAASRRSVDTRAVEALASSIETIGLQTPITVRRIWDEDTEESFILVTGRHRIEAFRKLYGDEGAIPAEVKEEWTELDARKWEISENLHRVDLTVLERSEQIEEWRRLTCEKVAQAGPPSGGEQPQETGIRKTAKALHVPRQEVQRAHRIASITPEAKQAARGSGLDDNQAALLKVADTPVEEQVARVWSFSVRPSQQSDETANRFDQASSLVDRFIHDLSLDASRALLKILTHDDPTVQKMAIEETRRRLQSSHLSRARHRCPLRVSCDGRAAVHPGVSVRRPHPPHRRKPRRHAG
jgi:ParB family chromosome partitioning protein